MTNQQIDNLELDREAWLGEAAQFILDDIITPALPTGHTIDREFRISVGFPPRSRAGSKVIAVCCKSAASSTGHNEIFVSPVLDNSLKILGAVTHELIHFADDCESGHRNFFAKLARRIGLEGKLTEAIPNAELNDKLDDIISSLGDIPHSSLDIGKAKAKQTTRMIKIECNSCEFSYRTTQKNIELINIWDCPACESGDTKVV